jgi:hypothetical protein
VHAFLDLLEVLGRERFTPSEVVIEAVLDRGADRDLSLGVDLLDRLRHHVRGVVAQELEPVRRRARDDLDARVAVDGPRQVAELAVDADRDSVALEARADRERDRASVDRVCERPRGPVRQGDDRHRDRISSSRRRSALAHCTITAEYDDREARIGGEPA